jgi:general secretion pathway protein D
MIRSRLLLWAILACTIAAPVLAESAESAFKAGERAEKKNDLDTAFQAFKRAHDDRPNDPKYMAAYLRLRTYASSNHIHAGQELLDEHKTQDALAEFRIATQIDPTDFEALGLVRRDTDEIQKEVREKEAAATSKDQNSALEQAAMNAAGPVTLAYKGDIPVSIHMTNAPVDMIYKTLARLGGLNILMDPDYKPLKVTFELSDVPLHDALDMLAIQTKTFWRPLSSNTILISTDNSTKRKELQQSVMKTFYLRNASTPADLQEAAGTLKGILDISHIQATPELRSLTLRGTPDQMVLAQKLLGDIDKAKPEVLVDVLVMEVSRLKLSTLGSVLPTSVSASIAPVGSSSSGSSGSGLTLNSFSGLTAGDISVAVSGASFTALASDTNTKVIQRPEIRVMDNEKASLRIGDRIPIATGSFQSGLTQGVNTQFQYIDVGVNIDITPWVHADNEVTLQVALEISTVTGETSVGGVTEPTIGQRRIEHTARLADGEVNLIGGILQDTDTTSLSGYPGILNFPILKYLFGQVGKTRQQDEIVFAIIPHIIRSTEVTDQNLKIVDLGSENSVTYHKADTAAGPGSSPPAPAGQQSTEKPAEPSQRPQVVHQ